MPFAAEFDDIYNLSIIAACDDCGVDAHRVDDVKYDDLILQKIYNDIKESDFIIAVMTGANANVFYEVGYAHALEKRCILSARSADEIPFDLTQRRHIIYKNNTDLKQKLISEIEWVKSQIEDSNRNPFSVEINHSWGSFNAERYEDKAFVSLKFKIKNALDEKSKKIEDIFLITSKGWKIQYNNKDCMHSELEDGIRISHSIPMHISRIHKGGSIPLSLECNKIIWSQFDNKKSERQENYILKGEIKLGIECGGKEFLYPFNLEVDLTDIPF